jgi:hypothetical protein
VFTFPSDPEYVISKMLIKLGDKTIESKVMDQAKAAEKFDDAVSGGNAAAMLTQKKDQKDLLELDVGNILPG